VDRLKKIVAFGRDDSDDTGKTYITVTPVSNPPKVSWFQRTFCCCLPAPVPSKTTTKIATSSGASGPFTAFTEEKDLHPESSSTNGRRDRYDSTAESVGGEVDISMTPIITSNGTIITPSESGVEITGSTETPTTLVIEPFHPYKTG